MMGTGSPSRPALSFFALAFLISWVAGLIVAALLQAILPSSMDRASLLLAKFGPTIAGLVMAAHLAGGAGVRHLLGAAFRVGVSPAWYAVALLTPPLLVSAALGIFQWTGGTVIWGFLEDVTPGAVLLALGTFTFLGGGLGEELGWRGFALPVLQRRMSALRASAILGIVWAAWHYPALLLDRESGATPIWLFTIFVLAATLWMTWMFNATRGNVLLAVLFHASFNATESLVEGAVAPAAERNVELILVGLYATLAVLVVLIHGPDSLARRPRTAWPDLEVADDDR